MKADRNLTCRQCGSQFVFTKGEQEFYEQKGFTSPSRCRECRLVKQSRPHHLVCSQCGTELENGAAIYCTTCLASVHLEFELETKQSQREAKEVQSELLVTESQKAELAESLHQKEQLVAKMNLKIESLSRDLEKAHQFHAALEWSQQALNGIEKRLEALEHGQNKINQRMLQVVQRMHEMYENTGLLRIIKRNLSHIFIDQKAEKENRR